jgi:hypothetical protein
VALTGDEFTQSDGVKQAGWLDGLVGPDVVERRAQRFEVIVVSGLIGRTGLLVEIEQRLRLPPFLEPGMEGRAATRPRCGLAGSGRRMLRANGSSGHTLARASAVTGLISSGSGSLHSCSLAYGRTSTRNGAGSGGFWVVSQT